MSLDVGAVDEKLPGRARVPGQRRIDPLPDALAGPAIEAVVDGRGRTILRRAVAPAAATSKDMDDPAQDAPVIDPRRATVVRQKRLDLRPLLVKNRVVADVWP